jgi:hypothetical protein
MATCPIEIRELRDIDLETLEKIINDFEEIDGKLRRQNVSFNYILDFSKRTESRQNLLNYVKGVDGEKDVRRFTAIYDEKIVGFLGYWIPNPSSLYDWTGPHLDVYFVDKKLNKEIRENVGEELLSYYIKYANEEFVNSYLLIVSNGV